MIIKSGQRLRRSDSWVAGVRLRETGSGVVGADYGARQRRSQTEAHFLDGTVVSVAVFSFQQAIARPPAWHRLEMVAEKAPKKDATFAQALFRNEGTQRDMDLSFGLLQSGATQWQSC